MSIPPTPSLLFGMLNDRGVFQSFPVDGCFGIYGTRKCALRVCWLGFFMIKLGQHSFSMGIFFMNLKFFAEIMARDRISLYSLSLEKILRISY